MSRSQDLFHDQIVYPHNSPPMTMTQSKFDLPSLDGSQDTCDFKAIFEAATPPQVIPESPLSTSTCPFSARGCVDDFDMNSDEGIIEMTPWEQDACDKFMQEQTGHDCKGCIVIGSVASTRDKFLRNKGGELLLIKMVGWTVLKRWRELYDEAKTSIADEFLKDVSVNVFIDYM
ncbi:hypothetical protein ElyMa_002193500 [Elysia marginata]|uniref:Uncharacterized protein n=1 Tax=Elysia marginata TaxID=1093978 RepID=A0AAV4FQD7_9GAST|nr:hypothetical protein ElyMa_002193500 [Elysia marginata]